MPPFLKNLTILLLIFLVSLSLNLVQSFLIASPVSSLYGDMAGYLERALRLLSRSTFSSYDRLYASGTHYFYALVLFLYRFLFPADLGLAPIVFAQAVLLSLANIMAGLVVVELFRVRVWGYWVMIAASLYWPFAALGSFFLAESLFMFLLVSGCFLYISALRRSRRYTCLFLAGFAFGAAYLVKGQAIAAFAPLLFIPFLFKEAKRLRLGTLALLSAFLLPIIIECSAATVLTGEPQRSASLYDAYNMLFGQSRRAVLGCLDQSRNIFFFFHNENDFPGSPYRFFPAKIIPISILDRSALLHETLALWQHDPTTQALRVLENMVELFGLIPRWPLRNIAGFAKLDVAFQWILLFAAIIPALAAAASALRERRGGLPVYFCLAPFGALMLLSGLTHGESRYLLPFSLYFFILAPPFYAAALAAWPGRLASGGALSSKHPLSSPSRFDFAAAILALIIFSLSSSFIREQYAKTVPPKRDGMQENYAAGPNLSEVLPRTNLPSPLAWFELGKDNELATLRTNAAQAEVSLELPGFSPGQTWARMVSWHAAASNAGSLIAHFPRGQVSLLALYLTDGDSFERSSRIQSGTSDLIADELHDGKWFTLPLSEAECDSGTKEVRFTKLVGSNVSLSAVVIY